MRASQTSAATPQSARHSTRRPIAGRAKGYAQGVDRRGTTARPATAKRKAAAAKTETTARAGKPEAGANPLLEPWTTPFEMPPFDRMKHRALRAGVRPRLRRQPQGDRGHRRQPARRRPSPTPSMRWSAPGDTLDRVVGGVLQPGRHRHQRTRSRRSSASWRRALPSTACASTRTTTLFARVDALMQEAQEAGAERGAGARARALPPRLRQAGRGARRQGARSGWRRSPQRMAVLGTQFSQNVLADEQAFVLVLEGEADLAGLPEAVRAAAAQTAKRARPPGQARHHAVALQRRAVPAVSRPGAICARRRSRPGSSAAPTAARPTTARSWPRSWGCGPSARRLLGFKTAADFGARVLHGQDARARAQAADGGVGAGARARAARSATSCRRRCAPRAATSSSRPGTGATTPRRCARPRFDVDDGEIKPYLQLDNVIAAAFDVAGKLFGVTLHRAQGPARLSPRRARLRGDARRPARRACSSATTSPGPRSTRAPGCRAGASRRSSAGDIRPIVVNVMNFAKGAPGEPTLLSIDDARTLFHEFGHAPARPAVQRHLSHRVGHQRGEATSSSCPPSSTSTG